jgi:hypothetical protein
MLLLKKFSYLTGQEIPNFHETQISLSSSQKPAADYSVLSTKAVFLKLIDTLDPPLPYHITQFN